jgi:hypothetical protein
MGRRADGGDHAMAMKVSSSKVIEDALAYRDERFEEALGRAVRRHGGTYEDYIGLISNIREEARRDRISLRESAKRIAGRA